MKFEEEHFFQLTDLKIDIHPTKEVYSKPLVNPEFDYGNLFPFVQMCE